MLPLSEILHETLRSLAKRRPVFHSEADFQLELGCDLRARIPNGSVRMEVPPSAIDLEQVFRGAIDIVVRSQGELQLIELKLGKAAADVLVDGERFSYPSPAPDIARYGFLQDLVRLERWSPSARGIALLLANDRRLWEECTGAWSDSAFDIHEGRTVSGFLDWSAETSPKTRKKRPGLQLQGAHTLHWRSYSTDPLEMRYLMVSVGTDTSP